MIRLKLLRNVPNKIFNYSRCLSTSKILSNKEYGANEEWFNHINNITEIGITKNASEQLGELIFMEFQYKPGDAIEKDEDIVILESVKATDSIKAPFDAIIVENNEYIEENLEVLNNDPDNTWIVKIKKN